MKFLYFSDTHIRSTTPRHRLDDFKESLYEAFVEIRNIGIENDVDFYIHGGDLVDRPDVPIFTIRQFAKVMQSFEKPIFFVPGNHDIFGYNVNSLNRTAIALLHDFSLITIMRDNSPICFTLKDTSVALHSASFSRDLDTDIGRGAYIVNKKLADFDIMIAHGMLLAKKFELINHTLVDEIKHTKADLTLSGHYHTGFELINYEGKLFYNPGSIARLEASEIELTRRPKVIVVELNKGENINIKDVYLRSAKKGEDILDRNSIIEEKIANERFEYEKEKIKSIQFEKMLNFDDILRELEKNEAIEDNVKAKAIELLDEVQNNPDE
ncbi:MAG: metallophosphoesterase [Ezakiella sp.]|nr:metallophosphoesterase [Ezakiella sp.]MDD7471907.1 metallophosphoesterase [Bacillota bacterium]MDY3923871.1 metallophosphoesterase [Ezakiella sp.]